MRIVDLQQRSEEWLTWRRQGITASDAPVVLGESPWKTPWRLWAEKTGLVTEPVPDNPHVRRGVAEEPKARRAFEERHGTLLLPVCGEHEEHSILRASFDGLDDDGRPVEIKAPSAKVFAEVREFGPSRPHLIQLQHQMLVAEAEEGWLAYWFEGQLMDFQIQADPDLAGRLVEASLAFWELVKTQKEPPKVPGQDVFLPGEGWQALEASYRALLERKKAIEAELSEVKAGLFSLEAEMLADMGELAVAETGTLRVCKFLRRGAIDYRKALSVLCPGITEEALEPFRKQAQVHLKVTLR